MRWVPGLTMAITLIPSLGFLIFALRDLWQVPGFVFIYLFPYFAVAASAWVLRHDARATWVLLLVACGVTGLGLCCAMKLVSPFLSFIMPLIQFLIWLIGGLVAGGRGATRVAHQLATSNPR
jgi:hypothetical protein